MGTAQAEMQRLGEQGPHLEVKPVKVKPHTLTPPTHLESARGVLL